MRRENEKTPGSGVRMVAAAFLATAMIALASPPAGAKQLYSDVPASAGEGKNTRGGKILNEQTANPAWESSLFLGKTLLKDDETPAPVPEYVEYPLTSGNFQSEKGGLEITVVRTSSERPPDDTSMNWNTVLDFVRPDNSSPLAVLLVWDSNGRKWLGEQSFLEIIGPANVWGRIVPLGRRVRRGETVTLGFAWGPGGNKVYVDGKETPPYQEDPSTAPAKQDGRFADAVTGVDRLRLGISRRGPDDKVWRHPMVEGAFLKIATFNSPEDLSKKPRISSLTDDSFKVAGISGKLVAGNKVSVELKASPGGTASFDMGNVKGVPLSEVAPTPGAPGVPAVDNGTYQGSYTIKPGDDYENGQIVGHFVSSDNVAADNVTSASKWTIDTKPVVTFVIDKKDLPADSATKARIKLKAVDANGNAVKGRHLKLTLSTTDEYTGTVGAGDFDQNVGATVETRWRGETDSWGEVEFDYKAGFAAKTVILSAKDLDSGGVTVDYITAYKEASIDIALTAPVNRAAARRGLQYILKVEASRTELTADGRSRSVIRAMLTDPNGTAVANDPISFSLSSTNGTLRTVKGTTDSSGVATAEYIAGKKIGIVVVTATATLRNASGSVSITLLSDAPAKIYLKALPQSLPADGFSRADLNVKVTDINDNPNKDTKVEFKVSKGGGKLEYADRTTDGFGDASNRYTAGTTAGIASIVATVRSKVPTDDELAKAKNVLFAPYSTEGDEIRMEKWLKKKGETFLKGDSLVEYTVGRGTTVYRLTAPYDGTMGDIFVEYWDKAGVGQTLAILNPKS